MPSPPVSLHADAVIDEKIEWAGARNRYLGAHAVPGVQQLNARVSLVATLPAPIEAIQGGKEARGQESCELAELTLGEETEVDGGFDAREKIAWGHALCRLKQGVDGRDLGAGTQDVGRQIAMRCSPVQPSTGWDA